MSEDRLKKIMRIKNTAIVLFCLFAAAAVTIIFLQSYKVKPCACNVTANPGSASPPEQAVSQNGKLPDLEKEGAAGDLQKRKNVRK